MRDMQHLFLITRIDVLDNLHNLKREIIYVTITFITDKIYSQRRQPYENNKYNNKQTKKKETFINL